MRINILDSRNYSFFLDAGDAFFDANNYYYPRRINPGYLNTLIEAVARMNVEETEEYIESEIEFNNINFNFEGDRMSKANRMITYRMRIILRLSPTEYLVETNDGEIVKPTLQEAKKFIDKRLDGKDKSSR